MKLLLVFSVLFSFNVFADNCASDAKKYCSGLESSRPQLSKCLMDYQNDISPACAKEMKSYRSEMTKKNPCFDDIGDHCSEFAGTDKIHFCLMKNESRLTSTCAADFKKKKGNILVRDVCSQDIVNNCYKELSGPDAGIVRCLIKNKSNLSKFCQNSMDKKISVMKQRNPCFDDTEKYCPTQLKVSDIQECLEKKINSVSASCKTLVESEIARGKANPCYKDLVRHCRPGLNPKQQSDCLALNDNHLTMGCKNFRAKEEGQIKQMVESCESDRLKLCPNAPFQDGMVIKCLKENKTKVSESCGKFLK